MTDHILTPDDLKDVARPHATYLIYQDPVLKKDPEAALHAIEKATLTFVVSALTPPQANRNTTMRQLLSNELEITDTDLAMVQAFCETHIPLPPANAGTTAPGP